MMLRIDSTVEKILIAKEQQISTVWTVCFMKSSIGVLAGAEVARAIEVRAHLTCCSPPPHVFQPRTACCRRFSTRRRQTSSGRKCAMAEAVRPEDTRGGGARFWKHVSYGPRHSEGGMYAHAVPFFQWVGWRSAG